MASALGSPSCGVNISCVNKTRSRFWCESVGTKRARVIGTVLVISAAERGVIEYDAYPRDVYIDC